MTIDEPPNQHQAPSAYDFRRGMRRLMLALYGAYTLGWVIYGLVSVCMFLRHDSLAKRININVDPDLLELRMAHQRASFSAIDRIVESVFFGAVVPAVITAIALVSLWIYRGFRPQAS